MKKHKLLLYEYGSARMRNKVLLLWLILLALALYDYKFPVLGEYWFALWLLIPALVLLWIYYAFFVRRAALIVTPNYLTLQGPLTAVKISYGRITAVTSTHLNQHYPLKSLKGREKFRVRPLYDYTCGFIELYHFPPRLKQKRRHFSRFLFSPRRQGLLLVVDDWMQLSRDVEIGRQKWHEARGPRNKTDNRSLAARILDY